MTKTIYVVLIEKGRLDLSGQLEIPAGEESPESEQGDSSVALKHHASGLLLKSGNSSSF